MEWTKIIMAIIAIASFIFTIFKTYREFGLKREISDLEQLMKFLSHEKQEVFKKQPTYIKDAFCQTVSFLKGHSFEEIEPLLNKTNIPLTDLQNLLRLKKMGVIIWDSQKYKLKPNPKYEPKPFKLLEPNTWRNISINNNILFNWFILSLFVIALSLIVPFTGKINMITLTILCILLAAVEIPILLRIDKIKATQNFAKNGLNSYLEYTKKS